jgi:hypothetical protein
MSLWNDFLPNERNWIIFGASENNKRLDEITPAVQHYRDCLFLDLGDALFEKIFEIAFLVILEIYFQT